MRARSIGSWVSIGLIGAGLVACGDDPTPPVKASDAGSSTSSGTGGSGGSGGAGGAAPGPIADQTFGAFGAWAAPIEDYKAIGDDVLPGQYDASINELMPFGDRMWFGYGDGTYNMGTYTPIEFRFFASSTDPTAAAAIVDGDGEGAPQDTPYRSGEEQIDRYRICDGELYQAGVDSIDADELDTQAHTDPKGIEGNAYHLVGDVWEKHRSIVGGEHVHDFAAFGGAIYGVGSGADFRSEFEAGQIFRYLWRSDDKTGTFTTVTRIQHPEPGMGDTRWVHLLPIDTKLYLFGYESDFQTNTAYIRNSSYDGANVALLDDADPLAKVFPFGTASLPDGTGLAYGVDVGSNPLRYAAFHVSGDGTATKLDALAGSRVVDVGVYQDTGEILYLVLAGDEYPGPDTGPYAASVLVAPIGAPADVKTVAAYTSDVDLPAIAYWQGALFLGTRDGQVLKASSD